MEPRCRETPEANILESIEYWGVHANQRIVLRIQDLLLLSHNKAANLFQEPKIPFIRAGTM